MPKIEKKSVSDMRMKEDEMSMRREYAGLVANESVQKKKVIKVGRIGGRGES